MYNCIIYIYNNLNILKSTNVLIVKLYIMHSYIIQHSIISNVNVLLLIKRYYSYTHVIKCTAHSYNGIQ